MSADGLLCVRADASTQMGTGHVMRCIALAQEWQRTGGSVRFVTAPGEDRLEQRLGSEGFAVEHVTEPAGSSEEAAEASRLVADAAALVIDGYHLSAAYRAAIDCEHCAVLVIDDCADNGPYGSDLLLNQNAGASADLYTQDASLPRLLLGESYTLLRREFLDVERAPRKAGAASVLVTLGGSDPSGIAGLVLRALESCDHELNVELVVGASNPRDYRSAAESSRHAVHVHEDVRDLAPLMCAADLAVTAGGSTCWELAYLGVPSLVIIGADNQIAIAEALERAGGGRNLGSHKQLTEEHLTRHLTEVLTGPGLLARMSESQTQLLDGLGSRRVVTALREIEATR